MDFLEETIAKVLKGHELTLCCNLDMDYFIKEMVDSFASLVQRTQQALEDTKLNDFECIESIIRSFTTSGITVRNRHDYLEFVDENQEERDFFDDDVIEPQEYSSAIYRDCLFIDEDVVCRLNLKPKDLLHFMMEDNDLIVKPAALRDKNYSLILDSDYNAALPAAVMRRIQQITPDMTRTREFFTEIEDNSFIIHLDDPIE